MRLEVGQTLHDLNEHLVLMREVLHDHSNLLLGFKIRFKVALGAESILFSLPVLAHHHDGARVGSLETQHKVQEDERIGIPVAHGADHVIDVTKENAVERVLQITGGKKADDNVIDAEVVS